MGLIKTIQNEKSIISIWKIEETKEELFSLIDERIRDEKMLSSRLHSNRIIEKLASRALLSTQLIASKINYAKLEKDEYGKPYLVNCMYKMSISHSGNYAALILSENNFTGIDVEINFEKAFRIRKKFMNSKELESTGQDSKKATLIWSAKESIYKAYGKKGLLFSEDMLIEFVDNITLQATFKNEKYKMSFLQTEDFVLTYL